MGKSSKIVILILVVLAGFAGFWFRNSIAKVYNDFALGFKNFQKIDIGSVLKEAGKEIFTPPPLEIWGVEKQVVLTKSAIILQTNLQRRENGGLPALVENKKLSEAALAKANDMFEKQYFEHVSPLGTGPADLVESYGYDYIATGENLILGNFENEKDLVQAWMDSPGHRANILNKRYTEIGVAIIKGTFRGKTAWIGVQEFGLPLSSCSQPSKDLENQIDSNNLQLESLSLQIDQKKMEIDGAKRKPEYNRLINDYNELVGQYNLLAQTTKNIISQYNAQVNAFNACASGK